MRICSTVIYFGDNPVGYELYKEEKSFVLKPAISGSSNLIIPSIVVTASDEGWNIPSIENDDVRQQIIRLIEINEVIGATNKLGAAS